MAVVAQQFSPQERLRIEKDFSFPQDEPLQRAYSRECSVEDGVLTVSFLLVANRSAEVIGGGLYKFRDEMVRCPARVDARALDSSSLWQDIKVESTDLRAQQVECRFEVPWARLPASIYGIEIVTSLGSIAVRSAHNTILSPTPDETLYCYRDPSGRMLRFELYHLSRSKIEGLSEREPPADARVQCLIGEYPNSARDNGLALFRALRSHPEISARYVVEAGNPDGLVPNGDDVLAFGSVEHLRACLEADVVAFAHHATYVLPAIVRHISARQFRRVKRFFLQHGITALKPSMKAYRKKVTHYDAFNVCSVLEQDIVVRATGFERKDVVIAGLPRHDELMRLARASSTEPSRILVFPTWRKGLERIDSAAASTTAFVKNWIAALEALRATGTEVTFILHPVIRRHVQLFAPYVSETVDAADFQQALVRSSALLTDYSSVCFEALYLGKPVFFYTFDDDEVGFARRAYIDVATQLPGPQLVTPEHVAEVVALSRGEGWPLQPGSADRFFAHRDGKNSERCAEVIVELAKRSRD